MDELLSRIAAAMARLQASPAGRRLTRRVRLPRVVSAIARRLVAPMQQVLQQPVRHMSGTLRRMRQRLGPGRPPILYRDPMMVLDRDGVVVSAYWFPMGRRRIRYERIRAVDPYPLSGARSYRVHGYGWPRQWYHRDAQRGERTMGLLLRTDGWLRPVLTPVEPGVVRQLLEEQIAARSSR